jgi:hypothetical protein
LFGDITTIFVSMDRAGVDGVERQELGIPDAIGADLRARVQGRRLGMASTL